MPDDDKLLTVREVADIFRVTTYTVRTWLRNGDLVGVRPGGTGHWKVSKTEVQKFAQGRHG